MTKPAHAKQERGLERAQIVRTALGLLHEVGYSGLTLRKLAARLNVKASALYWHFENKQDLIDAMAHDIMVEEYKETNLTAVGSWQELLRQVGRTNYRALLRYRDASAVLGHANMAQSDLLDGVEFVLTTLRAHGLSNTQALQSFFTVIRYTVGCAAEEQADPRNRGATPERRELIKRTMVREHPITAAMFIESEKAGLLEPQRRFEDGLDIIIAGIAHQLDASRKLP
jgi:TetR/AcrR family transcriptional regulator, tetracycline repressor protein